MMMIAYGLRDFSGEFAGAWLEYSKRALDI